MENIFENIKKKCSSFRKRNVYIALILLLFAFIVRIFLFGHPNQYVFDEVYFVNFISNYFTGTYYFDIHPPLGKLLMYVWGIIVGFKAHPTTSVIGENFINNSYLYLRIFPIVCGSLLSPIVFLIAKRLRMSTLVAFFVGTIVIFENSLIVESRFVLMDSSLLLFGFAGIYLYLKSLDSVNSFWWKLLSGISLSFAFGIKWTGITFLGIVILIEIYRIFKKSLSFRNVLLSIVTLILIPIFIYLLTFAIHFALLPNPGSGDVFMSESFKAHQSSFMSEFTELNKVMYTSNKGMTATHSYSSKWYSWPVMQRGIYYWTGKDSQNSMIYLLGNPFIYWFSLLSVIILMILFAIKKEKDNIIIFLIAGYFINLVPFALIERPMFLYHYFPSLIFAVLCLGYLISNINVVKTQKIIIGILLIVFISAFFYFSPLTYGTHDKNVFDRFWFSSWR